MTKQEKQIIILVVVLAGAIGALFGIKTYNKNKADADTQAADSQQAIVTNIDNSTVTGLTYKNGEDKVELVMSGKAWHEKDDATVILDADKVQSQLLSYVTHLTATKELTEGNESDYGLTQPQQMITVTTADKTYTISLGTVNEMTGETYIKTDEGKIYSVSSALSAVFETNVEDLLPTTEDSVSGNDVTQP